MHPRLNLNAAMLPEIKRVLSENNVLAKNFWALANDDFDGWVSEPPEGKSNYNGKHHAIIEAKALAYLITGDEKYGLEAIFAAKNYMLTVVIRHDLKGDIFRGWGRIMTVVGAVYDWCYPLMTDNDREQFVIGAEWKLCRDCTCGKGDKMTIGYPPTGQNAVQGHGTNVALQRDYLGFAIAISDEYPDWWELVGGRFYAEFVPANNVFYPAGMNTQGTNNYVWGKFYAQLHSAWLIKCFSGDIPYDKGIENVVYGLMGMKMPNGRYFQLGDGPISADGAGGRVTHLAVAAALFPSAVLKYHARVYTKDYTFYDWDIGGSMMSPALYAIFLANGYKGEEVKTSTDEIPLVHYYASPMGQMTARSDRSTNAAAVLMRVSELSGGNHDHDDAGSFQIYYKGCFTSESGVYGAGAGYGTAHHKQWHQASIAHNTVLVYNPALKDSCGGWYSGGQERHGGVNTVDEWLNTDVQRTGKI
ncbi:MAG: heparinase II/III family protein, partial [Clostridia bacterium]|nr:heparinase II/III family protein [Clostridia bacterium]